MVVTVTCPDCGQTDCEHAQSAAAKISTEMIKRSTLEHALATAFISMQGTRDAAERQRGWLECLRLAKEIERLNDNNNNHS